MADGNEVVVQFKAVVTDFLSAMTQASQGTTAAAEKINNSVSAIGSGFNQLMGTLGALSAVMAGGAAFKDTIDKTLEWNGEVIKLSRTLGITTEAASGMAVALHHVGVDGDAFSGIAMKMTRQMRSNEGAFESLGVKVKDSNGEWRNTSEVMVDAIEKLNTMKAGTDRNVAAQAMFGGRIGDLGPLLRINKELLEESAIKAEKYHLIVGPDGAAKTRQYKDAMADVKLIMTSLQVQIGNALMPVLLQLGQFMGEAGPSMAEGLGYAIKGVIQVFYTLKAVIETIVIVLTAAVTIIIDYWVTLGKMMMAVANGDFKGAVNLAKQGFQEVKNEAAAAADGIAKSWTDMAKNSKALWTDQPKKKSKAPVGDTLGGDIPRKKDKATNPVGGWEAELQAMKAEQADISNDTVEMSKQQEKEFWASKLALAKAGSAEWVAVRLKMSEDAKSIQKDEAEDQKKADKESSDLAKLASQEAVSAAKNALEIKKANLQAQVEAGTITRVQELALLKKFLEEELNQEIKAAQAEAELHKDDPVAYEAAQKRILAAKQKFGLEVIKLDNFTAKEEMKIWSAVSDTITKSLGTALTGLLNKTKSFKEAVAGLFQDLSNQFMQMAVDMAMNWVKTQMMQAKATVARAETETDANAVSAGAEGAKSAASIPIYGWIIALAAGAAIMAGVSGMKGSIGSAEGGWDIPSGLNPMAQLHEEEMVLPKEQANVIRDMARGGGSGGGQTHIHINAMDVRSFASFLHNNQTALGSVLSTMRSNGRA